MRRRICIVHKGNVSTFPKRQILHSSKFKVFAEDNFKLGENDCKFSKRVENAVGKMEIDRYISPSPNVCFQKTWIANT